ncbi:MAG: hypothetical protein R2697_00495 [Ilumatobacteraceae bacterium]
MGTTVTAVAVVADPHDGQAFGIANVGDLTWLRHARLRQPTIDHSFVQELVAEGAISREEARYHPLQHRHPRSVSNRVSAPISWTMPIFQGDRSARARRPCRRSPTITSPNSPNTPIRTRRGAGLVDAANEAGGRDNITVVIVDVIEGDDPPDPTEEFDVVPLWADDGEDTGEVQIVADLLPRRRTRHRRRHRRHR